LPKKEQEMFDEHPQMFDKYPLRMQITKTKEKLQEAIRFLEDTKNGYYSDYLGAISCIAAAYNMMNIYRKKWPPYKSLIVKKRKKS
jgi:hypothetical protein